MLTATQFTECDASTMPVSGPSTRSSAQSCPVQSNCAFALQLKATLHIDIVHFLTVKEDCTLDKTEAVVNSAI